MQQETEDEEMTETPATGGQTEDNILTLVQEACGGAAFYATDPSNFWLDAESVGEYPCVGVYEAQGAANWDAMGVIYPRVELHFITLGGAFDEREEPSRELADLRAFMRSTLRALRPHIRGGVPSAANFARKDSLYSLWVEVDFRDPYTHC